jgi:hypothetical protein
MMATITVPIASQWCARDSCVGSGGGGGDTVVVVVVVEEAGAHGECVQWTYSCGGGD